MHISLQTKRLHEIWRRAVQSAKGNPSLHALRSPYKFPMNTMHRHLWRESAKHVRRPQKRRYQVTVLLGMDASCAASSSLWIKTRTGRAGGCA